MLDSMRRLALNIVGSGLALLMFSACQKKDAYADISIIGHGGNGLENINTFFHDNSLESILKALETDGCDGVELDVQMSIDGTLWLYHDPDLISETTGSGCIPSLSDQYLETINYSTLQKEKLIRLSQVSTEYLVGRSLYIDVRNLNTCNDSEVEMTTFINELSSFRNDNPGISDFVVCTNSPTWLAAFDLAGYNTMARITSISHYNQLILAYPYLKSIIAANQDISKEEVSLIQSDGREVVIFNVRSTSGTRKAIKKLPNAIMTDDLHNAIIEKY